MLLVSTFCKVVLLSLIQVYQWIIGPLFPNNCRYYPSCSCYSKEAIKRHGPIIGVWLTVRRLLRCNVFYPGGFDPVP